MIWCWAVRGGGNRGLRALPPALGDCHRLAELAAPDCLLGGVPASLARCTALVTLDLSGNQLGVSADLPETLTKVGGGVCFISIWGIRMELAVGCKSITSSGVWGPAGRTPATHVIPRISNPRFLSDRASHDVAIDICQLYANLHFEPSFLELPGIL
jgi:hypothetical protein